MGLSNRLRIATNISELTLLVRATRVAVSIPFLLKRHDIRGVVDRLTPHSRGAFPGGLTQERAVYLCRRVLAFFARRSYKVNCLRRCLLLYNCLRYYGVPVVINFGVKPGDDGLLGHCWLSLDSQLLYDREEEVAQFTHMFTLPDSRPAEASSTKTDGPQMDLRNVSFDG